MLRFFQPFTLDVPAPAVDYVDLKSRYIIEYPLTQFAISRIVNRTKALLSSALDFVGECPRRTFLFNTAFSLATASFKSTEKLPRDVTQRPPLKTVLCDFWTKDMPYVLQKGSALVEKLENCNLEQQADLARVWVIGLSQFLFCAEFALYFLTTPDAENDFIVLEDSQDAKQAPLEVLELAYMLGVHLKLFQPPDKKWLQ